MKTLVQKLVEKLTQIIWDEVYELPNAELIEVLRGVQEDCERLIDETEEAAANGEEVEE